MRKSLAMSACPFLAAASIAECELVVGARVDATLQWKTEEELEDGRMAALGSVAESAVVECGRVDATLLNKVSHR